jgi:hypothetical protein
MAGTATLEINQYSVDSNDLLSEEESYTISSSWTQEQEGIISVVTATTDLVLTFTNLATATFIRINTDQTITLKLTTTGGSAQTFTIVSDFILTTTGATAIKISNASGSTATVKYELKG